MTDQEQVQAAIASAITQLQEAQMLLNRGASAFGADLVDDGGNGLPSGAIAYADFRNGTYSYGGNALSDFLTENTDWGTFDPTAVIPHLGLYSFSTPNNQPVLGSALAATCIANGFTAVVTYISGRMKIAAVDLPDYNEEIQATSHTTVDGSELFAVDTDYPYSFTPSDTMHRMAMTYQNGHAAMCIDGGDVVTAEYATLTAVNAIAFEGAYSWADITLYPAKADSELVTLTTFDAGAIPAIATPYTLPESSSVGDTLTLGAGAWTNAPETVTIAWTRGSTGAYLGSASTYEVQPEDAGDSITLDVFAENATGYAHFGVVTNVSA